MGEPIDTIELLLPFKAEYVSIARLTVSGVANRIGFDYDSIEDIKVAVAEVCNKLVLKGSDTAPSYKLVFEIDEKMLRVIFRCEDIKLGCIFDNGKDELGISIITALMDDIEFCTEGAYILSMTKALEGNVWNE